MCAFTSSMHAISMVCMHGSKQGRADDARWEEACHPTLCPSDPWGPPHALPLRSMGRRCSGMNPSAKPDQSKQRPRQRSRVMIVSMGDNIATLSLIISGHGKTDAPHAALVGNQHTSYIGRPRKQNPDPAMLSFRSQCADFLSVDCSYCVSSWRHNTRKHAEFHIGQRCLTLPTTSPGFMTLFFPGSSHRVAQELHCKRGKKRTV